MEEPAILNMNLGRFRRLLESETNPVKRRTIEDLIRETETQLQYQQFLCAPPPRGGIQKGRHLE